MGERGRERRYEQSPPTVVVMVRKRTAGMEGRRAPMRMFCEGTKKSEGQTQFQRKAERRKNSRERPIRERSKRESRLQ